MTADDNRTLDPERIATRGFSTSFRGFDTEEVRRFLEELASALRTQRQAVSGVAPVAPELEQITSERDDLSVRIADLEDRLKGAQNELREAEQRVIEPADEPNEDSSAPTDPTPTEFDEATMTALLGQETTRVLDAAREASRDIRIRAEDEARQRLEELEEKERTVTAELDRKRIELEELTTRLRTEAEEEANRVTAEAASAALATTNKANNESEAALTAARDEATEVRSKAKEEAVRLKGQAETDAATLRTEAEEAAASVRASAEADASSSQDAAREQARQMLNEAQAVREKVLADLVKRRRTGRQQLDQVKAARDRLARSLAVVRKDLDEAMGELVTAVPDARAAMEAVGRRVPESSDNRQAAELAVELDARGANLPLPGLPDDEDVDPMPDIDELFDRIQSGDSTVGEAQPNQSSKPKVDKPEPKAESKPKADKAEQKAETKPKTESKPKTETKPKAESKPKAEPGSATTSQSTKSGATKSEVLPATASTATMVADAPGVEVVETAEADETPDEPAAPEPFLDRDIALTRLGPDLRRQIKRALADDQSLILDLLRQSSGDISTTDLPAEDGLEGPYRESLQTALGAAATAGATSSGSAKIDSSLVDDLVATVIEQLLSPLRLKVERVVTDAGDKNEATEPIRAHYREARSNLLPDLVDDALANAFALGYFTALKKGSSVVWISDPRVEAGPDCYDNTLAGSVKKSEEFPTGHVLPPGSPGCRCLVVAAPS